jgi:hypothetical protein
LGADIGKEVGERERERGREELQERERAERNGRLALAVQYEGGCCRAVDELYDKLVYCYTAQPRERVELTRRSSESRGEGLTFVRRSGAVAVAW